MAAIQHENQRVGIFIDTQNIYHSARNLFNKNVNFTHVLEDAVAGRQLVRAKAYVITTESGEESDFFEALTKIGIETVAKDLQIFYGGNKKGDWDVGMSIDAVTLAPTLDAVVLVTGDGDFVPLVRYLQYHSGCQVEVMSFDRSSSAKLVDACDKFIDLGEDKKRYLMYTRKRTTRGKRSESSNKKKSSQRSSQTSKNK